MKARWMAMVGVVGLLCGGLLPAGASAGIISTTLVTDADAKVTAYYGAPLAENYGGTGDLAATIYDGNNASYMHFNLSGLNPSFAVLTATFKLKASSVNSNYGKYANVVAIMPAAEDWDPSALAEGTGTGANIPGTIMGTTAPKYNGSSFADMGSATSSKTRYLAQNYDISVGGGDITVDVTSLIQWALGQNVAYSTYAPHADNQLTIGLGQASNIYAYYFSKEYTPGNSADAPRLEITQEPPPPVPEPATLALLLLGTPLLFRRRT